MSERELQDPAISDGRASFDSRVLPWIEAFVRFVAIHWLALTNLALGVFVGLPLLAPILLASGSPLLETVGGAIFFAYRATCHQLPERSFFIFGEQVAWCERDTAIWGAVLLGGLLFSLVRGRLKQLGSQVVRALLRAHGHRRGDSTVRVSREHLGAADAHRYSLWAGFRLARLPHSGARNA